MQNILTSFGIQPVLLAAQIVNFLIIFYLLKRYAFGPIMKVLKDRRAMVAESIQNAEETERLLTQTEEKEKDVLKKAQSQAQSMITDAKKQAAEIQSQAEAQTKERVEKMIADAQKKIEEQTRKSEKELAAHVTKLSVEILEKSLQGFFTDKEQEEVLKKAVKQINA